MSPTRTLPFPRLAIALAAGLAPALAGATDGYFAHGYGIKSLGMGGASITRTDDAYGGANNPAQFAFVEDQLDLGLSWFSPSRSASRSGAGLSSINGTAQSGSTNFLLPELGYAHRVSRDWALGVTVYGNGGMNTDYGTGQIQCPNLATGQAYAANLLCGTTGLGIDLTQLIVAPTVGWKVDDRQSLGVSVLVTEQRFKATGLQMFAGFQLPTGTGGTASYSSDPAAVTDNGYSYSHGVGARFGYLFRVAPEFSFGLEYAPKTSMSKFDKYQGLFAGQGGFDLPVNYGAGASWLPADGWKLALDYRRILYSGVPSVGNPSNNSGQLGSGSGPGFGWKDVTVVKLGAEYAATHDLVLRAGFNHGSNPIGSRDVTFNILAPGVVQEHYTLGATWNVSRGDELSFALAYMPAKSVSGSSAFNPLFQAIGQPAGLGGTETISLSEKLFGVSWQTRL